MKKRMNIELSRFRVKDGKTAMVDEWMAFLNDNMEDVLLTLEGEKMHVETIFREQAADGEYLYWYSVRGEGGQDVMESDSWIDKKHLEYWDACIDDASQTDMKMEVSMIPKDIAAFMQEKEMDKIRLKEATARDMRLLWKMQVEAFGELLEKYQDHDMSPGAESFERVMAKFQQPWTKYYFITCGGENVGGVRIINRKDGTRKRISPIWIMPEHRNRGHAQQAIREIEKLYGPDHWSLDTILQEEGNVHLYQKVGYHQTGEIEHIKEGMDIVFFEKD